ncbi:MAG: hypothetical protein FWC42_11275 [Proteobacteria bacterium]|nr:hypothetical protein [Pseudomonadota bacterium]
MSRFLAIVFCLLFSCSAFAAEPLFIILEPGQGSALLKQCSRPTPQNVSGFWRPELSQIQELEAALPAFINGDPQGKLLRPLTEFKRQYIGFIQDGKKYIYGNFYLSGSRKTEISKTAVIVCDGGASFWGVVYSVEGKAFQNLAFNGVA